MNARLRWWGQPGDRSISWLIWCALAITSSGCTSTSTSPSVDLTGAWGGDHIAMTVTDSATHVEFDCAHGDIAGRVLVDARNQLSVAGVFIREHGGPIRVGELPDSHPARYAGSVLGNSMTLTVELTDGNETIGPFTLTRGGPARVFKCL